MLASVRRIIYIVFLFLFCVFVSQTVWAQSKAELQKKKERINQEIQYTNNLIKENAQKTAVSLTNLKLINNKIASREELIETIGQQISFIGDKIKNNQAVIQGLQTKLKNLKTEYAKMIYAAWKNRSAYSRLMFVFAARDFNQAYQRLKYLQQYADYRQKQAKLIVQTEDSLKNQVLDLQAQKKQRSNLLTSKEKEKQRLSENKKEQQNNISQLNKKQKSLKAEVQKKRAEANKLNRAIEEIIKREIAEAKRKAREKNKNSKNSFPLSPEAQKLSNSFAANKGKLPWPVDKGVITSTFGEHPHPVLSGVKINNNGIDISTSKGAVVHSIFRGKVTGIIKIPGEGIAVMVRHGAYLSVYTYMSKIFVKKGETVKTKQALGVLAIKPSESSSDMHLEIWKGITKLNPAYWILNR